VPESGFTMFLGGSLVAEVTSFADDKQPTANYPGQQNARWVMQTGRANVNDSGATRITFSPAYSDRPTFFVTSGAGSTDRGVTYSMADGSYATIYGFIPSTGAASNIAEVDWLSLGTVDF
jgi:hypothetical protein